ncbi:hypothetical protein AMAG_17937 [Allomyces macrogynus ATCC 38327]|uniref:Small ribosomal subunit protein mS23 n=1 Tax=Allomyces macrogynus (strain ATCC 38327) TaxID=578462 RepID=A0A0L0S2G4_ALLM3|nr:hypothetical protein AMAG_17937 [Allomyces macrogynus ATCC 38327]|eukprot:KNE56586.1 hypothetical protein AMAG_17937 [Allomyces macrogynus ATCC 38327]
MPKAVPVFQNVLRAYQHKLIDRLPAWHGAMRLVPPTAPLPRAVCQTNVAGRQPFEAKLKGDKLVHYEQQIASLFTPATKRSSNAAKHLRTKRLRPQPIVYPEDRLRERFYRDHPFELVRPKTLVETVPQSADYSKPLHLRQNMSGEDVIQYQLYLVSQGLTINEAYDQAVREFRSIRLQEEAEERVRADADKKAKVAKLAKKTGSLPPMTSDLELRTLYPENYPAWLGEEETLIKNSEHYILRQQTMKAQAEQL